ncbi:hypothetical protein PMAYCL1PPCAC_15388, partial [Pristionchus mayeri]
EALFVVFALPPVIILISLLRKIALHVNCNILAHASFVLCDMVSIKYIPTSNSDPEIRLLIFGVHGFVHAFSSFQELLFSIERAFACANPSTYHDRSLSVIPLLFAEIAAVLEGCLITNIVDFISLMSLLITKIWTDKKKKNLILSALNEKYQIKETLEITKVVLPCGLISLFMKITAMSMGWIYALQVFKSEYTFVVTAGLYFMVTINQ